MTFNLTYDNLKKRITSIRNGRYLSSIILEKNKNLKNGDNWLKKNNIWIYYIISTIFFIILFSILNLNGYNNLMEILKNLITLPLLLMGIVIPIIILLINVIENRIDSGFLHVYLENLEPLNVLKLSIVTLLICIFLYFFGSMNFNNIHNITTMIPITPIYGAIIISSIVFPLIITFFLISKILKYITDDLILYDQILIYFRKKVVNAVFEAVGDLIFKNEINSKYSKIITNKTFATIDEEYSELKSSELGIIVDIDLNEIDEINKLLQDDGSELVITAYLGQQFYSNLNTIGYLKNSKEQQKLVNFHLNKALIIRKNNDDIKSLSIDFQKLNVLTINSMKGNDKERFERYMDINLKCLEYYITLLYKTDIEIPNSDDYFDTHYTIHIIEMNIQEFISGLDNQHKEIFNSFRIELYYIIKKSMEYENYQIFKLILRILTSIYLVSTTNKIKEGQKAAIEYHKSLLFEICSYLQGSEINTEKFDIKLKFINIIFKNLYNIFTKSIEMKDYISSNKISNTFNNPFPHYKPHYDKLIEKENSLKQNLQNLTEDDPDYKIIKNDLELIDKLYNFQEFIKENLVFYYYNMGTYILDNTSIEKIDNKNLKNCFEDILTNFPSHEKFLDATDRISKNSYLGDNKLLFFCLVELNFLKNLESIPPLEFIYNNLNRIKSEAKVISKNYKKLTWLNIVNLRENIKNFIIMCEASADEFNKEEVTQIIESNINEGDIEIFKTKLIKFIEKNSIFENLFNKGNIVNQKKLKSKLYHSEISLLEHKEYFIGDVRYMNPSQIIPVIYDEFRRNKHYKDTVILKKLYKSSFTKKMNPNIDFESNLNQNINEMENLGFAPNLIILPLRLRLNLNSLKDDPDSDLADEFGEINNLIGLYHGIPVISPFGTILKNELIIMNIEKGCELIQNEDLSVLIHDLTEKDKKNYPKMKSQELNLSVIIKISEKYEFNITNEKAIFKLEL